ncbi:MAG: serine/threonine protein kinase [Deltaproteobacteria bacterium]|nr:serine/threonine protein kinase [Deltaproteobacteria bacterium]
MKVCPVCRAQFPPGANFCPDDGHALEKPEHAVVAEEDLFLGALLDERYRVEAKLGEGGMGIVYAARHEVIDKPVAIKILRHEYCRDKGLVQRFIREARAASRIGHPNIVDVTDFGKLPDGHIYFVMEYLMGTTLGCLLRENKEVPLPRVIDLVVQMCHGLAAAHAKGIVHRDLKPENIFVVNPVVDGIGGLDETGTRHDFVKLLDFGIAKFNFGQKTRLTRMGAVFGTPQYMSPEQAAGEDSDHRGDIYALGCILYEMVTGQVPFVADTFMGTLTKHMFEAPMRPRRMRPELHIPEPLEEVILKMLAKEPASRFDSATDVVTALHKALSSIEGADVLLLVPDDMLETRPPVATNLDLRGISSKHDVAFSNIEEKEEGEAEDALVYDLGEPLHAAAEPETPAFFHRISPLWALAMVLLGAVAIATFIWAMRTGAMHTGAKHLAKRPVGMGTKDLELDSPRASRGDAGLEGGSRLQPDVGVVPDAKERAKRFYNKVWVDSIPGGALVKIGGNWTGKKTPLWVKVPVDGRGKVRVTLFLAGFKNARRTLRGKRQRVRVKLKPGGALRSPFPKKTP